jgi:DNA-binding GntR family transcriptional regulator
MRERIKQILLDRILNGTYQPGDRLIELQIAKEFNTSQAPVREALRQLESTRLVESEPYRGTRVREITLRELQESCQVRGALEALAARLAAPKLRANPDSLLVIHKAYKAAAKAKDVKRFAELNAAFHQTIVEAAQNEVLLRLWHSLSSETLTHLSINRFKLDQSNAATALGEHQQIIDAFLVGDGESASALMQQHAETVLSLMTTQAASTSTLDRP